MSTVPDNDFFKQARESLTLVHTDLLAATKKALADDGRLFFGATSALDAAVESLFPPHADSDFAMQSCREALQLLQHTRAYAQRASGGPMAKTLESGIEKIAKTLKHLERGTIG